MSTQHLVERMRVKQSLQQNIPYEQTGAGSLNARGASLMRSGDRFPISRQGGFGPAALLPLLPLVPVVEKLFGRPISKLGNKLWSALGLGQGTGALTRSGGRAPHSGFFHKAGDIGIYTRPSNSGLHIPPAHSANNASFGGSVKSSVQISDLSKKDLKNLKILEGKLAPLTGDKSKFMAKLQKIHAMGEGYFRPKRRALKKLKQGRKVFRVSKRYKALKLKHYTKYPKAQFGKYLKSAKYKKHKAKYATHHLKKKAY